MTVEIIGFPRSNFVRAVRMAAEEKGISYDHNKATPHSDEVKAINPFGLIPVMKDGGLEISESIAIAQYFDRAFDGPALVPSDAKAAAKVDQWVARITTSLDQLLMRRYVVPYAFHRDDDGNVIRTEIDKAVKRFPKVFPMLDAAVADGFIAGADFSLADCFLTPMLAAVSNFPEGKEAIEANPNLKAYFERMSARESFQNTAG